jgi:tetratricopeptide (TPR) repeat protein
MRFLLVFALFARIASAQVVQGFVRNTSGQTIAGVTVTLRSASQASPAASTTDSKGSYRIHPSRGGTYTLHAEAGGYAAVTTTSFVLGQAESKKMDLTLKPLEAEFFDEPNFVVAGVTDPTAHGGHGSDTVLRSTEVLTKETASLGDAAENQANALEAVRQYQRAAEQNPTEPGYFVWASELLTHRATIPAIEVFSKGARLFPGSARMLLGLAVAWYSNGSEQKAQQYFFEACDLNPEDPKPYLFLGKVQSNDILHSDGYLARMERFNRLHPESALANYYYAASLWVQRESAVPVKVEPLLAKAIQLDPHLSEAYLLLGILYSDRKDSGNAIAAFQKADLDEAHYRLSQEYRKLGDTHNAQKEIDLYNELSKKSAENAQKERLEIQQFVYSLR